jgi:hypothetical protein
LQHAHRCLAELIARARQQDQVIGSFEARYREAASGRSQLAASLGEAQEQLQASRRRVAELIEARRADRRRGEAQAAEAAAEAAAWKAHVAALQVRLGPFDEPITANYRSVCGSSGARPSLSVALQRDLEAMAAKAQASGRADRLAWELESARAAAAAAGAERERLEANLKAADGQIEVRGLGP